MSVLRLCLYLKSHTETPDSSPVDLSVLEPPAFHQQLGIFHPFESVQTLLHITPPHTGQVGPTPCLSSVSLATVPRAGPTRQKQLTLVDVVPQL